MGRVEGGRILYKDLVEMGIELARTHPAPAT